MGRAAPDASLPEPLSLESQLRGRETPVPEFILCSLPAPVCTLVFLASWRCRPGACGGGWGTVGCDVGLCCLETLGGMGRPQSKARVPARVAGRSLPGVDARASASVSCQTQFKTGVDSCPFQPCPRRGHLLGLWDFTSPAWGLASESVLAFAPLITPGLSPRTPSAKVSTMVNTCR